MIKICLSLGSNIEPEKNLKAACVLLEKQLGPLIISSIYVTEDEVYQTHTLYSNLSVVAETHLSLDELIDQVLHPIERQLGRTITEHKTNQKIIDIDVSYYGDEPVETVTDYFYRLAPLAEIAPEFIDLGSQKTLSELLLNFKKIKYKLYAYRT